jgi:transcriptional regulator with XRE-family HTH domain
MGNTPTKAADNIYCKCRKAAAKYNDKLNSREGAAELLGLSVSSLSDYELGLTKVVPVDKVALMADLYNAPELKPYYCAEVCPLGCDNPKISLEGLDRVTIKTLSVSDKVDGLKDSLLKIVADGFISEEEKPELNKILATMDEVDAVFHSFRLWAKKNQDTN